MSKYIVDDNDRVEVKLYIDTRKKKLKIYDEDSAKKLLNDEIEIKKNKLATLIEMEQNEETVKKKEDLEKEIEELKTSEYPSYLNKESAFFVHPDGAAQEYIDKMGYKRILNTNKLEHDSVSYNKAFLKMLLKEWTFSKNEPVLNLDFEQMPGFEGKQQLTDGTISRIYRMDPDLYKQIIQISYVKIYGDDDELKN